MFRYKFLSMVIAAGLLFSQSIPAARAATVCNSAQFVSDLTIPDGSSFAPGVAFRKSWRLLNNGTCTWSTSYTLVWAGGDQMNAPLSLRLPVSVAPGRMLDISVNLTAPAATGHYKGLFRFRNAAGGLFGVGPASSDPFWVDINVTDIRAVIYDFVANAPYAQWKSGAGALPFPGASGDFRGYSSQVNSPHLEDDSYDNAPGLLTVPQNRLNGYIQATYPEFQVQSGDKLQTLVNCEFAATGCSATFRIDYLLSNNVQKTLWTWREAYDRRFYRADLDLSSLAGQKVRFVFMLLSNGSASGDRAIWGSPRIVRLGGGLPPAPPATLTPLPALTPTATPLVPPPPTPLQPAGCDKAMFVTDVTVQDGTSFAPDETFTKTWRLKNSGACVWTPSYKLVYYSGDQMGAPTTVNFPSGVTPNQSLDLSVNMVAPHIPGNYRGYWILVNASGQYFGIGADASKPIWVDINVSGEATQEGGYAFWMNACSAEWRTGSGPLTCPGTEGDSKGFIVPQLHTQLEDGNMGPAPSLLISPENKYNGYIQGVFPAFTVLPGDHFVTGTGCEYGYSCYVTFRLDYMTANGGVFNFWSWREQKDNKNNRADVDLSPLAGRSVRFILTILATGTATGDRVRWIGPDIVRVSPEIPPTITPSPTFTPAPTVPPAPAVVPLPQINKLFMIDSANGWGIGNSSVVRTSDGGATWYNFSMPNVTSVDHAFFQNASKGWVIAKTFTDMERTALYRTIDGGRTWITYSDIPFNQGLIQFLDDSNGFVLAGMPDGMQKHAVQLYQTADGGATWTLKYANDPSQPGNTLPFGGHKDGMGFRNTTTGWVGGDYPTYGAYLFKTTDSGTSWAPQPLTLPSGYETAFLTITGPTFFGSNDAVLPVWMTIGPGMRDLFLYVTHDGGNTWTGSAGFARNGINADFVSLRDAFSWDWDGFFYVTNNTGASWRQVRPNVDFGGSILAMDFVSTSIGWVIDTDQNGHTALYRTNNGGLTWNQLYSNIPTQPVPNLAVSAMHIELQNTSCLLPGDQMGVRVWVTNDGPVAAGSFVVRIPNVDQTVSGLAAGETTSLFFPGYSNPVTVTVDPTNAVLESNEYDNLHLEYLPVPTPPLPCPTPAELLQKIVTSLNAHDFVAARNPMGQTFNMAFWQSQGNSYTPDEAIAQLQTNYIGASTALVPDPSKDLSVLLDRPDPYSIVGLNASNSLALFVSGWGLDGKGEAVLFVTQGSSGPPYWHSVLIAPTGFAPPTLPTPYAVIRVAPGGVLNIHSDAAENQPVIGSFAFDAVNVRRTGPGISVGNATWVEVINPSGGLGWVNSDYLTEYVTREFFCNDQRVKDMINQLKASVAPPDGNLFASLVGPKHGVAINFWRDVPPVEYTKLAAQNIFADTAVHNWGSGPAAYPDGTLGTFAQIVKPDLVDVFNSSYQLGCDDPSRAGMFPNAWSHTNIHYYSILKPPSSDNTFDWKVWLIGFEYVDGVPYIYGTVHYVWDT